MSNILVILFHLFLIVIVVFPTFRLTFHGLVFKIYNIGTLACASPYAFGVQLHYYWKKHLCSGYSHP